MRCLLFFLSVFTFTLLACDKSTNHETDIYKQWKWENTVGGFTGIDSVKSSPNSTVTLTFKTDMTYETRLNGQVVAKGNFQIQSIDNFQILKIENFTPVQGLWLENNGSVIQIENHKLHLVDYLVTEPYTHNFE